MAITTPLQQIEALYIGYFGRAGEPDGTNYWVGQLNGGYTISEAAASFSVQPESKAEYAFLAHPNLATDADIETFINSVYQNLFHRDADTDGMAYWSGQLAARAGDPAAIGQFILDVISGAYGENGSATDQAALENKVQAASYFTQQLFSNGISGTHVDADGNVVLDANLVDPSHAAVSGVTDDPATVATSEQGTDDFLHPSTASFEFTSVTPETLHGLADADNTFHGTINNGLLGGVDGSTYQSGDSAVGGSGHDTLALTVQSAGLASIALNGTSIEEVSVTNNQLLGIIPLVFDAGGMDSLDTVTLQGGVGGQFAFLNVQTPVTTINVNNPTSIGPGTSLGIDMSASVAAPDALPLVVNLNHAGDTELNYTHAGDDVVTGLTLHVTGDNSLEFDNSSLVTTITIDGAGSLDFDLGDTDALTSIDASALTKDLTFDNTIDLHHDLTFAGAQGDNDAEFDTYDGTAHNLTVTGQGGDDSFSVYMDDHGGTVNIDAGAGDNYVFVDDVGADGAVTVTTGAGVDDISVYLDGNGGTATIDAGDGGTATDVQYVDVYGIDGATVSVTTGAGVDHVYLNGGAAAAGLTVSLGAGDDVLSFGHDGLLTSDAHLDGGDGVDTLIAYATDIDTTGGNPLVGGNVVNFENMTVEGQAATDIDFNATLSGISHFTFTDDVHFDITISGLKLDASVTFGDDQAGNLSFDGIGSSSLGVLAFNTAAAFGANAIDLSLTHFGEVDFNAEGDLDLGNDNVIDAQTIKFTNTDTTAHDLTFDWSAATDDVVNFTNLDMSGFKGMLTGALSDNLAHNVSIKMGDFTTGSTLTLDAAANNFTDTLVFKAVTTDTDLAVSEFQADGAAGHDILDLSAFGLKSSDLNVVDAGGNTTVSFDAGGHTVDITLVGITGLATADIIAHNIVL